MFILNGSTRKIKPCDIENFIKSIAVQLKAEYEFVLLIDDDLFSLPHMEFVNYNYLNQCIDWATPEWFEGQDINKVTCFIEGDLTSIAERNRVKKEEFSV